MNENEKLAELLLPDIDKTPEYYENLYKDRNLPEGSRRIAVKGRRSKDIKISDIKTGGVVTQHPRIFYSVKFFGLIK